MKKIVILSNKDDTITKSNVKYYGTDWIKI